MPWRGHSFLANGENCGNEPCKTNCNGPTLSTFVWNTVYLSEAIKVSRGKDWFNESESLLNHISPLGWECINFLGEYRFNTKRLSSLDSLRPLQDINKAETDYMSGNTTVFCNQGPEQSMFWALFNGSMNSRIL